jgi:hypothetical protein
VRQEENDPRITRNARRLQIITLRDLELSANPYCSLLLIRPTTKPAPNVSVSRPNTGSITKIIFTNSSIISLFSTLRVVMRIWGAKTTVNQTASGGQQKFFGLPQTSKEQVRKGRFTRCFAEEHPASGGQPPFLTCSLIQRRSLIQRFRHGSGNPDPFINTQTFGSSLQLNTRSAQNNACATIALDQILKTAGCIS